MSSVQNNNSLEVLKPKYISKNIICEIKTNAGSDILTKSSKGK
ncbi:exodeoxyribonuclease V subunit alpha [Arcobacter sp.]